MLPSPSPLATKGRQTFLLRGHLISRLLCDVVANIVSVLDTNTRIILIQGVGIVEDDRQLIFMEAG